MTLKSRFLPWQPKLVFSGYSYYTIDSVYGKITGQRDVWDAIQDTSTPSVSSELLPAVLPCQVSASQKCHFAEASLLHKMVVFHKVVGALPFIHPGMQVEGIAHVIKQLTTIQLTPNLDSPQYTVLKKTKEYEIRHYSRYLVAETSMASDTRPAGGDGFNQLAGYIFGGNSRCGLSSLSA